MSTVEGDRHDPGAGFRGVLHDRWRLILAMMLLTTVAAITFVAMAPRVYQAEADLLISPISRDNETLGSLGLLRESSDPTRDVETVARLIPTLAVEQRATRKVPRALRDDFVEVSAMPVAQSSIVSVVVDATDARAAAAWANGYAEAFIEVRTQAMRRRAAAAIVSLEARLEATRNQSVQDQLSLQLTQLQRVQEGTDPTVDLETQAAVPPSPVSPRPALTIAAGLIFGGLLGIGGAFALQSLDPRLRREGQLRSVLSAPVVARVSAGGGRNRRRQRPRAGGDPASLPPSTFHAPWSLRTLLNAPIDSGFRVLAVTSTDSGEGKSTVALSLAYSLARAGEDVILVEADLRRASVASWLGLSVPNTSVDVAMGLATLDEALVRSTRLPANLQLLLANPSDSHGEEPQESLMLNAPRLLDEVRSRAPYVVVDAPPLSDAVEALAFTDLVDDVVLAVRLGHTRLERLAEARDALGQESAQPVGLAVVGR